MKVELLIADDKELRASVRELIKSEVLNMARKDIKEIISSAIAQRVPDEAGAQKVVEQLFRDEIKQYVTATLKGNGGYSTPTFVQSVAREEIRAQLQTAFRNGNSV
jgi:hypothetical protein